MASGGGGQAHPGAGPGPPVPPRPRAERTTAIFARLPRAGDVKTRLSPPLDLEEAALLAEAMLLDVAHGLARAVGFQTALLFAPAEAALWFRERLPGIADQRAQRGASLGERLAAFFEEELARPGRTAVAVASDAPLLGRAAVERAHALLEDGADLVLGPDQAGGCCLVGLRRPAPELFRRVGRAAPRGLGGLGALEQTLALARRCGLATARIEAELQVHSASDLGELARRLAARPRTPEDGHPRCTAELLEDLGWSAARGTDQGSGASFTPVP